MAEVHGPGRAGQPGLDEVVGKQRIGLRPALPLQVQPVALPHRHRLVRQRQEHRQPGLLLAEVVDGLAGARRHDGPQQAAVEEAVPGDGEFRAAGVRGRELAVEVEHLEVRGIAEQVAVTHVPQAQAQVEGLPHRLEQPAGVVGGQRPEARSRSPGRPAGSSSAAMRVTQISGTGTQPGAKWRRAAFQIAAMPSALPMLPMMPWVQTSTGRGSSTPAMSPWSTVMRSSRPRLRDQVPRAPRGALQHLHRVDVRGAGLDAEAREHRVLARADVQHHLARHRGREGRAVGREAHRLRVHQAVEPLVVDAVGAEGGPELRVQDSAADSAARPGVARRPRRR